jgi:hypothetical protein
MQSRQLVFSDNAIPVTTTRGSIIYRVSRCSAEEDNQLCVQPFASLGAPLHLAPESFGSMPKIWSTPHDRVLRWRRDHFIEVTGNHRPFGLAPCGLVTNSPTNANGTDA